MVTAIETFEQLAAACEEIRNTDPQSLANMEVGDEWRQGDLRIIRLADDFGRKHGDTLESAKAEKQLAPGTTQGSRHLLSRVRGIKFFRLKSATALDGPVIEAKQTFSITHPEHGDCVDIPPGWYAFPGQRAFADELRRAKD